MYIQNMFDPQEVKQLKELFSESEKRMGAKIDRLSNDIGNFIDNAILPQIAEKADKSDIRRLEHKIDRIIDKNLELEVDVKKLKAKVFVN